MMKRVWSLAVGLLPALFACGGGGASSPSPAAPSAPASDAPSAGAPAAPADPNAPIHLAAGDFHTCALRGDGTVRCWGRNKEGQLGDLTSDMRTAPVLVMGVSGATQLALGSNFSCALLRDKTVTCWGAGKAWGDGRMRSNVAPTHVAGVRDVSQIDAGGLLVCAVISGGAVKCWGNEGDTVPAGGSVPPTTDAVEVSVAAAHACARMRDGSVRCWGDSPWNGTGGPSMATPRIARATHLTTGDTMACALGQYLTCWGRNDQGELGRPTDNDWHPRPEVVPLGICPGEQGPVVGLTAGQSHVCAIVANGSTTCVSCWGSNSDGELGRGWQGHPEGPDVVPGVAGVAEMALGADHVCARLVAGGASSIWCWGSNAHGQLGDGTTERRTTPARVAW
jgi:alpha-tubulin suppressor-like RCC1 family protein